MSEAVRAAIALGANIENPEGQVRRAFEEIANLPKTRLLEHSQLYRTAPMGMPGQPPFVNACALVETSLAPRELLEALLALERAHGRVRTVRDGPRSLDLDIVLYGDRVVDEPGLEIPHPRAQERAFVLAPLLDVWPDAHLPGKGDAIDFLEGVQDQQIERLDPGPSPPQRRPG